APFFRFNTRRIGFPSLVSTPEPFHLGKFSLPIAIVATLWMTFSYCESEPGITGMNYTAVVFCGGDILLLPATNSLLE
ncbi:hypothetical protein AX14_009846, partial [Amanita brunnescens Koide BX004]